MAQIELHERFFGPGMVGTVDLNPASGADVERLRYAFVDAADRAARELTGLRADVAALGWSLDGIAGSIWTLEASLGSRLDTQTAYLADQVRALESIDHALRSPAKVRAAERMGDAAGLLRSGRYDRALQCADEAIDADPNHPGGFAAAGWAYVGLERMDDARRHFMEASVAASEPEESAGYARQGARLSLVLQQPGVAAEVLQHLLGLEISERLRGAVAYDLALALTLQANDPEAARWIEFAVRRDESFAQAAVAEPIFEGHASVIARALEVAREIAAERAEEQQRQEDERRRLEEAARLRQRELDELSEYRTILHRRVPFAAPPTWNKKQVAEFEELRARLIRFLDSAPREVGPDTEVAAARAALEPAEEMLNRLAELKNAATSKRGRFFGR